MKSLRNICIYLLLFILFGCTHFQINENDDGNLNITEQMIFDREIELKEAFKSQDIDKILSYMSDDCVIIVFGVKDHQTKTLRYDKPAYGEQLAKSFENVKEWDEKEESEILNIDIPEDMRSAKVVNRTVETGIYKNSNYRSENIAVVTLELVGNKLISTRLIMIAEQAYQ